MSNPAKAKGDQAEREVAKLLSDRLGFDVKRKLGAGRAEDTGDLYGLPDCTAQVKNYTDVLRAIREGLPGSVAQQANAQAQHGVLFVRRRGGEWVAVLTLDQWCDTYREAVA